MDPFGSNSIVAAALSQDISERENLSAESNEEFLEVRCLKKRCGHQAVVNG
jgi:hypothetical protein